MTTTNCYNTPELKPTHELALDVLVAGGTHGEAADAAGVHRVTVTNWINKSPTFAAEYNRRRLEVFSSAGQRLRGALVKAVEVVVDALDGPEPRLDAALALLRMGGFGALSAAVKIGSTDPERILVAAANSRALDNLLASFNPDERWQIEEELRGLIDGP